MLTLPQPIDDEREDDESEEHHEFLETREDPPESLQASKQSLDFASPLVHLAVAERRTGVYGICTESVRFVYGFVRERTVFGGERAAFGGSVMTSSSLIYRHKVDKRFQCILFFKGLQGPLAA